MRSVHPRVVWPAKAVGRPQGARTMGGACKEYAIYKNERTCKKMQNRLQEMLRSMLLIGIVLGALVVSTPAQCAPLTNGSFENGLTGWSVWGNATAATTYQGVLGPGGEGNITPMDPTDGTHEAVIVAGSVSAAALATDLGLPSDAFDNMLYHWALPASYGSAISQTITVRAGDIVQFTEYFKANDSSMGGYWWEHWRDSEREDDFCFVSVALLSGDSTLSVTSESYQTEIPEATSVLSLVNDVNGYHAVGNYGQTMNSMWFGFDVAGTYKIGFGAFNSGDNENNWWCPSRSWRAKSYAPHRF